MSGMKFRLQCARCQDVFFSPDRRARFCPKCSKTQAAKSVAAHSPEPGQRKSVFDRFSITLKGEQPKSIEDRKPREKNKSQIPKITDVLTPELREEIEQLYRDEFEKSGQEWKTIVGEVSNRLSVTRQLTAKVLSEYKYPKNELTPELRERAIEMYAGYVDRGERPPDGRRRTIAKTLRLSFAQVKQVIYEWSKAQYEQSLTPELKRENYFAIEKAYWAELNNPRYPLAELPDKIAAQLAVISPFQVARWIEMLHDDNKKLINAPEVEPEVEQRIIEAYEAYLAAPAPPEQGLHATIAAQVGGVTSRQAHKTLLNYRLKRRAEYPL